MGLGPGVGSAGLAAPPPPSTDITRFGPDPGSSALMSLIQNMPQFKPVTAPSASSLNTASTPYQQNAYQAKDMSKTDLPQYDAMRQQINNQYSQQQSQAQDSLDRQFAAMGGGPGNGAQAKQTENLATGIAQQKGQDLLGVNAQEAQTRTGLQQQENQNAFQSGEAQKGYAFQAGQGDIGRQFQANQNAAQMGMQAGEFNNQMGFQQSQAGFQNLSAIDQLNLFFQQTQQQAMNDQFNKELAQYQAAHSGGLLGGGGFLGTGIGA